MTKAAWLQIALACLALTSSTGAPPTSSKSLGILTSIKTTYIYMSTSKTSSSISSSRHASEHSTVVTSSKTSSSEHSSTSKHPSTATSTINMTSTTTSGNTCTHTKALISTCLAIPGASVAKANTRTVVVGAALGTILGSTLITALTFIFLLRQKLKRATAIIKEQSDVLWRMSRRNGAQSVG